MALKKNREPKPGLRLAKNRRNIIVVLFSISFIYILTGFVHIDNIKPKWPQGFEDVIPRGKIISRNGTVFAEGLAEHRRYPQNDLASHIIGFSGKLQDDGRYGLEGLEYSKDKYLQSGQDVVITIDPYIQAIVQAYLKDTIIKQKADNGTVVVLEAGTGRIIASASYPDYNLNQQSSTFDRSVIVNKAFLNLFEPGSVMKPFIVASLLESHKLSLDEYIDTPMTKTVGEKTYRDVAQHASPMNPWDILRFSSNTGMINLSKRFTDNEEYQWLKHIGFGTDVGLKSAYTRSGNLRPPKWVPQDQASITIGQSISTTTLQLAALYSIFANDGVYIPPYLIEDEARADARQIFSIETARTVRSLLKYVVDNSSLHKLMPKNSSIGGKTGTADIYNSKLGRYVKGDYSLTFAGIFPIENPKLTIVVSLQKPKVDVSSTYVAAPLFAKIQESITAYWQTAPEQSSYASLGNR